MQDDPKTLVPVSASQVEAADRLMAAGRVAGWEDIVAAGLALLDEVEALPLDGEALEHWLRSDVLPVVAASRSDPARRLSGDAVRDALEAHRKAWERGQDG